MLTPHAFQEDMLPRIARAAARMQAIVWPRDPAPLAVHATEPTRELLSRDEGTARPTAEVATLPDHWGHLFDQRWCRVQLPRPAEEGDWLEWRGQGETTVYHDGLALGGADAARRRTRLPPGARLLWVECLAESLGIWVPEGEDIDPQGCRFDGAFLTRRDDHAWRCHTDFETLRGLLELELRRSDAPQQPPVPWGPRPELNRISPLARVLIDRLNAAVDAFDARGPEAALAVLDGARQQLRGGDPLFEVTLTGHAHIDLVWRWPERTGEFKACHTFANALALMDRDPAFVFGYSQPLSYHAVRRRDPALFNRVRARIAERRWEPTGTLLVESDTQLACGEALARSFTLGQKAFAELTGEPSPVVWLPDAFGYAGCLPQLALESGATAFFTTKAHWNHTNRFPHAAFVWRGQDNSEILGFVPGDFDYNGEATPHRMAEAATQQRQAALFPRSLAPTGHGDGGGGPTEEMCRRVELMADLAGLPRARWGRVDEFFRDLATKRERLPVWQGEIYLEYHRGVQTTARHLKQAFRAAERALQAQEAAHAAAAAGPIEDRAWQRLVFSQFHDAVPGSSCGEVYAELIPELETLAATANAAAARALEAPSAQRANAEPSLFNPLPLPRTVLVDGELHTLPPLAGVPRSASRADAPPCRATAETITSDRVTATINPDGLIASLAIDGHAIDLAAPAAGVLAFADRPHAFEAWDIDRATLEHPLDTGPARVAVEVTEPSGPVAALTVRRDLPGIARLETTYRVVATEPALRVDYTIDLEREDTLLKAVFPTAHRGHHARFAAPFGSTLRPQRPGRRQDEAAFESPASRWATVCDDPESRGLAIIAGSSYGFGCQAGTLHLSLLRSAIVTSTGLDTGPRRDDAGPTHFDLGRSTVSLALARAGAQLPAADQPAALAETLFAPAIPYAGPPISAGLRAINATPGLVPCWAKPADDGHRAWILRLHETLGRAAELDLDLEQGVTAARVDLLERPTDEDPRAVRPYAFASVRIERPPA